MHPVASPDCTLLPQISQLPPKEAAEREVTEAADSDDDLTDDLVDPVPSSSSH